MSGSLDTSIRVWDVESGNCLHTLIGHQSLTSGMELKVRAQGTSNKLLRSVVHLTLRVVAS